jgi:hypothetical protein
MRDASGHDSCRCRALGGLASLADAFICSYEFTSFFNLRNSVCCSSSKARCAACWTSVQLAGLLLSYLRQRGVDVGGMGGFRNPRDARHQVVAAAVASHC